MKKLIFLAMLILSGIINAGNVISISTGRIIADAQSPSTPERDIQRVDDGKTISTQTIYPGICDEKEGL